MFQFNFHAGFRGLANWGLAAIPLSAFCFDLRNRCHRQSTMLRVFNTMPCTVFIFPCADFMYFVLKCPICHLFNTLRIFCVIYRTLNLYNFCQPREPKSAVFHYSMMTPSYGNIFSVTGPLWGEFIGHQWFPLTKASDAELWCFLWSGPNKRLSK